MDEIRDVAIIGGGPAGLAAGIYLGRDHIDSVLLEMQLPGGQAMNSPLIENYPGFPDGIAGADLLDLMKRQAERFGLEIVTFMKAETLTDGGPVKTVTLEEGELRCRAVIIASGRTPRKLGIPGEDEYIGRGISYCATCDAPLFKDKTVMVVGGGDAAAEEALHLAKFASRVVLVHRRGELRASDYLRERAASEPKLEFVWDSEVTEVKGSQLVESATVRNIKTGESRDLSLSGVFFYVGNDPNSKFAADLVKTDEAGYVLTDDRMETDVPGVFAAGDVRSGRFKQVVTAVADGALAAAMAQRYLESVGARKAYEGGH